MATVEHATIVRRRERNELFRLLGDVNNLLAQLLPTLTEKEFVALAAAFRPCTFDTGGFTPEWLEHGIREFRSRRPLEAKEIATEEEWEGIVARVRNFDRLDSLAVACATAGSVCGLDCRRVEALAVQAAGEAVTIRYKLFGAG